MELNMTMKNRIPLRKRLYDKENWNIWGLFRLHKLSRLQKYNKPVIDLKRKKIRANTCP